VLNGFPFSLVAEDIIILPSVFAEFPYADSGSQLTGAVDGISFRRLAVFGRNINQAVNLSVGLWLAMHSSSDVFPLHLSQRPNPCHRVGLAIRTQW
jgi:hypothetical protein